MNIQQLFSAIENEAEELFEEIVEVVDEALPVVVDYLEDFLAALAKIALQAVLAEWGQVKSGQEKFGAAVTHVIQQVEIAGKEIALNDAHMVVQAAYNQVVQTGLAASEE